MGFGEYPKSLRYADRGMRLGAIPQNSTSFLSESYVAVTTAAKEVRRLILRSRKPMLILVGQAMVRSEGCHVQVVAIQQTERGMRAVVKDSLPREGAVAKSLTYKLLQQLYVEKVDLVHELVEEEDVTYTECLKEAYKIVGDVLDGRAFWNSNIAVLLITKCKEQCVMNSSADIGRSGRPNFENIPDRLINQKKIIPAAIYLLNVENKDAWICFYDPETNPDELLKDEVVIIQDYGYNYRRTRNPNGRETEFRNLVDIDGRVAGMKFQGVVDKIYRIPADEHYMILRLWFQIGQEKLAVITNIRSNGQIDVAIYNDAWLTLREILRKLFSERHKLYPTCGFNMAVIFKEMIKGFDYANVLLIDVGKTMSIPLDFMMVPFGGCTNEHVPQMLELISPRAVTLELKGFNPEHGNADCMLLNMKTLLEQSIIMALIRTYGKQLETFYCDGEFFDCPKISSEMLQDLLPSVKNLHATNVTEIGLVKLSLARKWRLKFLQLSTNGISWDFRDFFDVINTFSNSLVDLQLLVPLKNDWENSYPQLSPLLALKKLHVEIMSLRRCWFWSSLLPACVDLEELSFETIKGLSPNAITQKWLKRISGLDFFLQKCSSSSS
ncbi:unnamed protein product [Orchesella dallaii]|uniref:Uncharacterized protein n=1 Tax=Orchesella dallaii TaxID=48710 RepID=A0ABP1S110_9HEXA